MYILDFSTLKINGIAPLCKLIYRTNFRITTIDHNHNLRNLRMLQSALPSRQLIFCRLQRHMKSEAS